MKKLLLVILLSATSIDAKITDTRLSGGDLESDYSERQVWWKREKRKDDVRKSESRPSDIFSFFPLAESVESSVLSTLIRYLDMNGRPGSSQDRRKSVAKEHLRYRIANSMPQSFGKLWKPLETDKSYFTSCDSRKECQEWQIQKPFYVDEPRWIKIDKDLSKTRSIHRLDVTDPFVISRGKKVHGVDQVESKRANVRDRFERNGKLKFEKEERNGDDENESKRVSKNTTETFASELAKRRVENEVRFRSNKFHPLKYGDRSIENAMLDESDSVLFLDRRSDRNFLDIFDTRNRLRCPLEPCLPDKMDEEPKSKRVSDLDSSIGRSVAKDMLERLIENLECDTTKCTDQSGRTMKRTRLADGRGILEHLLTKSDPFYVARGKRVSRFSPVEYTDRNL